MKIAAAWAGAVELRFARPMRTAAGEFTTRQSVILQVTDDDGLAGYGEAAPWPGFGTETAAESLAVLQNLGPELGGADVEPAEWPTSLTVRLARTPAARAALEGALWDLRARRAQRPLAELLATCPGRAGAAALRRVPVSALLAGDTPQAIRAEAARLRVAGYLAAKIKLGARTLAEDVARAGAARDGLGPRMSLRGDANGAWTEPGARAALEALAPFEFAYIEQPLPADAIDALARLRRASPVRIAADESVATEMAAARLMDAGAVDVIVLKPAVLGGPARALGLAARARLGGCEVVFTHAFESAVGARHALHCAAAWGDAAAIHGLVTHGLFVEDVAESVTCRAGIVELSDAAGLGVTP